jgi:hypothetical protein
MYTTASTWSLSVTGTASAGLGLAYAPRTGRSGHDCDHGFCTICGAVWPCSRARREQLAQQAGNL